MAQFDLRVQIRKAIKEHPVASLGALVDEVESHIPDDKLRVVLLNLD